MLDAEELSRKLTDAMERLMCKRCDQFNNGCNPAQIIACTKYFMDFVDKISEQKKGD